MRLGPIKMQYPLVLRLSSQLDAQLALVKLEMEKSEDETKVRL